MYELADIQTRAVSGGYTVYVTEEWKEQEAFLSGIGGGILGGICGGAIGLVAGEGGKEALGLLTGGALGGYGGFKLGKWLSWLENRNLQNNTWYDFVTVYYY